MAKNTRIFLEDFRGHHLIAAAASNTGSRWSKADTSAAGSPTVVGVNEGGVKLTLAATNEVENLCVYMGDILPFKITDLIRADFFVSCIGTLDASVSIAFGLASARNDDPDSLAAHASFRLIANNNVVVESDDGTNDKDDISTGLTLGTTPKRFSIDFASGNVSKDPPALSTGKTSNVHFYGANSVGSHRRVASGTLFDMSNYTSGLQPYVQIQKTASTAVDWVILHQVGIEYRLPNYA